MRLVSSRVLDRLIITYDLNVTSLDNVFLLFINIQMNRQCYLEKCRYPRWFFFYCIALDGM